MCGPKMTLINFDYKMWLAKNSTLVTCHGTKYWLTQKAA